MRACLSPAGGMCGLVGMKIDSTAGLAATLLTEPVEELDQAIDWRKIGTGSGIDTHTPLRSSTARDA